MAFGLILAGGRSQRFGGEKAVACLSGVTLLELALARLAVCEAAGVNAGPGSEAAALAQQLGAPLVSDAAGAPAGPLAGVAAGLAWAEAAGETLLLTLPCDTPLLPDDLAVRLLAAVGDAPAAVARTPKGVESLCAVWRTTLLPDLQARLAAGEHPAVHRYLEAVGAVCVDWPDASAFLNINMPADLAEAERRLSM